MSTRKKSMIGEVNYEKVFSCLRILLRPIKVMRMGLDCDNDNDSLKPHEMFRNSKVCY